MSATFATFDSWADLLAHITAGHPVYYHAPLDYRPCPVSIERVYRNGKVRVRPPSGCDADPFTADTGHLSRFKRKEV